MLTDRSTKTRDKILQAAFSVLSRQGYENSSIKEIAEGGGVLDFIREDRSHIEAIAREVLAEREADPTPARAIASVIEAAVLGIMVQNLIDPDFDAEEAVDTLNTMSLSAIFPPAQGA